MVSLTDLHIEDGLFCRAQDLLLLYDESPADQRRALVVEQQQILGAAEQVVLNVQIGQRNHSPSRR